MTINLLKRLESSVHAFRITLQSLIDLNRETLKKIDNFLAGDREESIKRRINGQNRLHPYYLVYVKENGETLYSHTEVKSIMDALRAACKGKSEPLADLCRVFNRETKDGAKMDKYSSLLQDAVASIVQVKEENDLSSLFKKGSSALYQMRIEGLDDFELIAFVVVK